jgi:hypothetical protein
MKEEQEEAMSSVMGKFPTSCESSSISKTLRYNVQLLCMLALHYLGLKVKIYLGLRIRNFFLNFDLGFLKIAILAWVRIFLLF